MTEIKKPSLIELRKKANSLGIADYAKYSKDELSELISQKEAEISSTEEDQEKPIEETADSVTDSDSVKEEDESTVEKKEDLEEKVVETKVETSSKKAETKKKKKEEKKIVKKQVQYSLKEGVNLSDLSEKGKAVVEALQKNDGRSPYRIGKDCGTYHSVVMRIVEKYFDVK